MGRSVRPGRARDYRLERRRSVGLRGAAAASQLPGGPAGGHGRALLEHDCDDRAVHLHARQTHVEVRLRRQQQRGDDLHGARRGGGALWPVQLSDRRKFQPGGPLHLSDPLSDSRGRHVLQGGRLAHQRLRRGQVAGDGQADPEPRLAVRLLGHRAGLEGRHRAPAGRGVCREREDGLPRRRRQVLRAGAEPVHVPGHVERGDRNGLYVRYRDRSVVDDVDSGRRISA